MAETNSKIHTLIDTPFRESNIAIRLKVLEKKMRSRLCGELGLDRLVAKYQRWHEECTGEQLYTSRKRLQGREKLHSYSLFLPVCDDGNTSDDGLDGERHMLETHIDVIEKRQMRKLFEKLAVSHREKSEDEIIEGFFKNIHSITTNSNSMFTLKLKLLSIKEDIYRIVSVPSSMAIAIFQEKVLCPVMDWWPNFLNYTFQLSSNKYSNSEKPENLDEDICISSLGMNDVTGLVVKSRRGGSHVVDDRKVGLFQVLHDIDDSIYYYHGNQRFMEGVIPIKVTVLDIQLETASDLEMKDVKLISGRGPFPEESGSGAPCWPVARYYDDDDDDMMMNNDDIVGIEAFCISFDIVQNSEYHEEWEVKKARKHLKLQDDESFSIEKFDLKAARKRLHEASRKMPIKRGAVTQIDSLMRMAGFTSKNFGRKAKCSTCGKQEYELGCNSKLKRCGRCGVAFYCNKECQTKDWKTHKNICVAAKLKK